MKSIYWLSDAEWSRIEPLMPRGRRGTHRVDDRRVISHYIDGSHGIKDLDVWVFFRSGPARPFPYRRRGVSDFGDPKFGRHLDDRGFVGRRVDVMGRDILVRRGESAESAIVRYLREGRTTSAAKLAERPVILLWPRPQCGRVIWRPEEATEGGRRRA